MCSLFSNNVLQCLCRKKLKSNIRRELFQFCFKHLISYAIMLLINPFNFRFRFMSHLHLCLFSGSFLKIVLKKFLILFLVFLCFCLTNTTNVIIVYVNVTNKVLMCVCVFQTHAYICIYIYIYEGIYHMYAKTKRCLTLSVINYSHTCVVC